MARGAATRPRSTSTGVTSSKSHFANCTGNPRRNGRINFMSHSRVRIGPAHPVLSFQSEYFLLIKYVISGEEGQDAGGLLREWYMIISREIFNPDYALFTVSPGDRVTYTINPSSHCNPNHLLYFKFVGRLIGE